MKAIDVDAFLKAGRVPPGILPWQAEKSMLNAKKINGDAFLFDVCLAGLHRVDEKGFGGYTIMDDHPGEVIRHLDAVRHAQGRVLKTGLGLGCFVRMALKKPNVEHIDVIEINEEIASHFGAQFKNDPRVTIHIEDAFKFPLKDKKWNFAWHDIYCEGNKGLSKLHTELIIRYLKHADAQGAWGLERWFRRALRSKGVIII